MQSTFLQPSALAAQQRLAQQQQQQLQNGFAPPAKLANSVPLTAGVTMTSFGMRATEQPPGTKESKQPENLIKQERIHKFNQDGQDAYRIKLLSRRPVQWGVATALAGAAMAVTSFIVVAPFVALAGLAVAALDAMGWGSKVPEERNPFLQSIKANTTIPQETAHTEPETQISHPHGHEAHVCGENCGHDHGKTGVRTEPSQQANGALPEHEESLAKRLNPAHLRHQGEEAAAVTQAELSLHEGAKPQAIKAFTEQLKAEGNPSADPHDMAFYLSSAEGRQATLNKVNDMLATQQAAYASHNKLQEADVRQSQLTSDGITQEQKMELDQQRNAAKQALAIPDEHRGKTVVKTITPQTELPNIVLLAASENLTNAQAGQAKMPSPSAPAAVPPGVLSTRQLEQKLVEMSVPSRFPMGKGSVQLSEALKLPYLNNTDWADVHAAGGQQVFGPDMPKEGAIYPHQVIQLLKQEYGTLNTPGVDAQGLTPETQRNLLETVLNGGKSPAQPVEEKVSEPAKRGVVGWLADIRGLMSPFGGEVALQQQLDAPPELSAKRLLTRATALGNPLELVTVARRIGLNPDLAVEIAARRPETYLDDDQAVTLAKNPDDTDPDRAADTPRTALYLQGKLDTPERVYAFIDDARRFMAEKAQA